MEAARILGYRPNISAKRLRNNDDKVLPSMYPYLNLGGSSYDCE